MQDVDTGNAKKKKQCLFPRSSYPNEDRQVNSPNLIDIRQLRKGEEQSKLERRKNSFLRVRGLSCCLKEKQSITWNDGV